MNDNNNNMPDVSTIDIDLLLRRLKTDYPQGYNYRVLREAAAIIEFYRADGCSYDNDTGAYDDDCD